MKASLRSLLVAALALGNLFGSGCLAHFIGEDFAKEAKKGEVLVASKGLSRSVIIGECGQPTSTQVEDGKKLDNYLLPNEKWIQIFAPPSPGPKNRGMPFIGLTDLWPLLLPLAVIVWTIDIVGDPIAIVTYEYQNRDATKCEYTVTYDQKDDVSNVKVSYPRGFGPEICAGEAETSR